MQPPYGPRWKPRPQKPRTNVISGVAVCAGADKMGKAWTLNEINDTSALLARIKANLFDIDKTPLRLAAEGPTLHAQSQSPGNLEREAPIHSTLDFSPLAMQIRHLCITEVHIRKESTDPRDGRLGSEADIRAVGARSAKCH